MIAEGRLFASKFDVTPPVAILVTAPPGVIRAIRPGSPNSVNHKFPSEPAVIPAGFELASKFDVAPPVATTVTTPAGVIRMIRPGSSSFVNHRFPSGPRTIFSGSAPLKPGVTPFVYSVTVGVIAAAEGAHPRDAAVAAATAPSGNARPRPWKRCLFTTGRDRLRSLIGPLGGTVQPSVCTRK